MTSNTTAPMSPTTRTSVRVARSIRSMTPVPRNFPFRLVVALNGKMIGADAAECTIGD